MTNYVISGNSVTLAQESSINEVKVSTFSSNGTYTPDANLVFCFVKAKGAGGGGGGSEQVYSHPQAGGGGGEGGETSKFFTLDQIGSSCTITIGVGGGGGNSSVDGGDGTSTLFGSFLTANGGLGGQRGIGNNAPQVSLPGNGGSSSGGSENLIGETGQFGMAPATGVSGISVGGKGGGKGGGNYCFIVGNGNNPVNPGCGGGGSVGTDGIGANGSDGIIIIHEYIS